MTPVLTQTRPFGDVALYQGPDARQATIGERQVDGGEFA